MKQAKEKTEVKAGKTYIATAKGFDGMAIREKGEIFYFEGPKGSWMEEVDAEEKVNGGEVVGAKKDK